MSPVALSICVPTYNRADTLVTLIESVYADGHESVEVVVSDNASTDGTEAAISAIQARFPRVRYHRNETNLGIDRNFLMAASLATGRHSVLMGSDDAFPAGAIDRILTLCADDPDIIVYNRIECDRELNPIHYRPYQGPSNPARLYNIRSEQDVASYFDEFRSVGGTFTFISSNVYRTSRWQALTCPPELIGKLYPHLAMLFQMMNEGCAILYSPEYLVLCRLGNDSFSDLSVRQRLEVDIKGFAAVGGHFFANQPAAFASLNRLLVREHTVYAMGQPLTFLSYRVRTPDDDWAALVEQFRSMGPLGRRFRLYNALTPNWLLARPVREFLLNARDALKS